MSAASPCPPTPAPGERRPDRHASSRMRCSTRCSTARATSCAASRTTRSRSCSGRSPVSTGAGLARGPARQQLRRSLDIDPSFRDRVGRALPRPPRGARSRPRPGAPRTRVELVVEATERGDLPLLASFLFARRPAGLGVRPRRGVRRLRADPSRRGRERRPARAETCGSRSSRRRAAGPSTPAARPRRPHRRSSRSCARSGGRGGRVRSTRSVGSATRRAGSRSSNAALDVARRQADAAHGRQQAAADARARSRTRCAPPARELDDGPRPAPRRDRARFGAAAGGPPGARRRGVARPPARRRARRRRRARPWEGRARRPTGIRRSRRDRPNRRPEAAADAGATRRARAAAGARRRRARGDRRDAAPARRRGGDRRLQRLDDRAGPSSPSPSSATGS